MKCNGFIIFHLLLCTCCCVLDAKSFEFRETIRGGESRRGDKYCGSFLFIAQNVADALRFHLQCKAPQRIFSNVCLHTLSRILQIISSTCNSEFSPDNTAAIKLKFTDCGCELVAAFNSAVLGLHTLAHVFLRLQMILSQVKFHDSDIVIYASLKKLIFCSSTVTF